MTYVRSICLVLIGLVAAPAGADEIKTLAGKTVKGTLEKISGSSIVLKDSGASIDTPLPQILDLTLRPSRTLPAAGKYIELQLADESILRCTKVVFRAKEVQVELTTGTSIKIPQSALVTVLRDAQEEGLRTQFAKLSKKKKNYDRVYLLRDGDLNPLDGALGDIDEEKQTVRFKHEAGKEFVFQLEKLHGIQFVRTETPSEASVCRIIDVDGNLVVASKLSYDGAQINVTTPFGSKIAFDPKTVARFDFNFGRLTYLSDLDAKISDAVFLGGFNPVRKDTNLDGASIMLQDKKYDKGLSMYAGVELEYDLGQKYKDFKALLGVDSRIAEEGQGKVTVTIYCDGEKRHSYEVSAKAPIPITVNVKDIGTLRIVVSGSNFTNYSGHATLANAHVSQ